MTLFLIDHTKTKSAKEQRLQLTVESAMPFIYDEVILMAGIKGMPKKTPKKQIIQILDLLKDKKKNVIKELEKSKKRISEIEKILSTKKDKSLKKELTKLKGNIRNLKVEKTTLRPNDFNDQKLLKVWVNGPEMFGKNKEFWKKLSIDEITDIVDKIKKLPASEMYPIKFSDLKKLIGGVEIKNDDELLLYVNQNLDNPITKDRFNKITDKERDELTAAYNKMINTGVSGANIVKTIFLTPEVTQKRTRLL